MNRIEKKLSELKENNRKALVTFITCGDGGYDTTEKAVSKMISAGADIITLGVPFSDPIAEGNVTQAASVRAMEKGTTIAGIFELIKKIRKDFDTPIILKLYLNSVFGFGTKRFFDICAEIGVDGVIIPDMPFEEKDEIQPYASEHDIISISIVTPTSKSRIEKIVKDARGFIYCLSTGTIENTDFCSLAQEVKTHTCLPCIIGSEVSKTSQAEEFAKYCDGILVENAAVEIIANDNANFASEISKLTAKLRKGLDK